jgi:hypothetical protein
MDGRGLVVRNCFHTYRLSWAEVRCFTNGSVYNGHDSAWALRIVLRDGRKVTVAGTARATDSNAKIMAIRQVAGTQGITADIGGSELAPPIRPPRGSAAS